MDGGGGRHAAVRRAPLPGPVALAALVALTGWLTSCSDDAPGVPASTTTVAPTTAATPTGAPAPGSASGGAPATGTTETGTTATGTGWDCAGVRTARDAMDAAYDAELDRLDVGRGDEDAQAVLALVTADRGPDYYGAVLAAAPPGSADDARTVLDYYARLSDAVGDRPRPAAAGDLPAALARVDAAGAALAGTGTSVVAAQERLQAAVDGACSGPATRSPTAPPTGASTSPPG